MYLLNVEDRFLSSLLVLFPKSLHSKISYFNTCHDQTTQVTQGRHGIWITPPACAMQVVHGFLQSHLLLEYATMFDKKPASKTCFKKHLSGF